jgi:protein-arginine kinase activator protein McsA
MKCETCGDPASVCLTTLVARQPTIDYLCERCAELVEDPHHPRLLEAREAIRATAIRTAMQMPPPPACEACGRIPKVHVREIRRGAQTEHHLCEACFVQRQEPAEAGVLRRWVPMA